MHWLQHIARLVQSEHQPDRKCQLQSYLLYLLVSLGASSLFLLKPSLSECAAEDPKNIMKDRVFILQEPANDPIEDRFNCYQLKNIQGYYTGVFDGHGGWQVSDFAMRHLHAYLDEALKNAKTDEDIKSAIVKSFNQIEKEWYDIAKISFFGGFARAAYVGSCALISIVHNNKLYVANLGDSKAVLLRKNQDGSYSSINVTKTYNANKQYEQERLKKQFKGEEDIIVCKHRNSCYVKGNLQPTRAFGDLRLKNPEFNFHNFTRDQGYRKPIPQYTGPYISFEPDIKIFDITDEDEWLIIATDGLWDEVSRKQAAVLTKDHDQNQKDIAVNLFYAALNNVSKKEGLSREFISQQMPGKAKRKIHDDITILVVNLKQKNT